MAWWPSIGIEEAIQRTAADSSKRRRDRRDPMLIEARLEARHPATHLVSRPSFEPVEPNEAIFEETNWRELKHRQDAGGIALSRWAAAQGSERTHHAVTPDDCHLVPLALRPTRLSLCTSSRQLFEGSI